MDLSTYFDTRLKFRVHITQLCLIILVIILSIASIAMKDPPPQRAHIMGVAIGLKSIVFIIYQVLTEHNLKLQKWANKKTNLILNCVDIPFWAVMMGLLLSTNANVCVDGSCAVSWIMALLAIALFILTFWAAIASYFEYRYLSRKTIQDTSYVRHYY
ncbi:hypothetical protein F5Y00DRAFT_273336 [Daldinia vernicosa]|uniref:uncharacterized protein n=1 Tax=Daldinia vernicosa TaxID=114800 RepID=UPI002008BCEF|nr:uncharacterized protein F5Y00DRAFT_273336 [Daldinia vernicosa]KAI0845073.1 hypothetical protein F5Y00DRAFT_273336 [Daldinia vernicosa]